jgi:hypothetical protein
MTIKAIRPEIWFPLIRAAWSYVRTFAPDILRAIHRCDELRAVASPSILARRAARGLGKRVGSNVDTAPWAYSATSGYWIAASAVWQILHVAGADHPR